MAFKFDDNNNNTSSSSNNDDELQALNDVFGTIGIFALTLMDLFDIDALLPAISEAIELNWGTNREEDSAVFLLLKNHTDPTKKIWFAGQLPHSRKTSTGWCDDAVMV